MPQGATWVRPLPPEKQKVLANKFETLDLSPGPHGKETTHQGLHLDEAGRVTAGSASYCRQGRCRAQEQAAGRSEPQESSALQLKIIQRLYPTFSGFGLPSDL